MPTFLSSHLLYSELGDVHDTKDTIHSSSILAPAPHTVQHPADTPQHCHSPPPQQGSCPSDPISLNHRITGVRRDLKGHLVQLPAVNRDIHSSISVQSPNSLTLAVSMFGWFLAGTFTSSSAQHPKTCYYSGRQQPHDKWEGTLGRKTPRI